MPLGRAQGVLMKEPWDAKVTQALGSTAAVVIAVAIVLAWLTLGPFVGWTNELWHLSLNSPTTATTYIMVFVILRAQNRDTKAIHAKLDTLVHGVPDADDAVIGAEHAKDPPTEAGGSVARG